MTDVAPTRSSTSDDISIVDDASVRPFRVEFPEDAIVDLRRRIAATGGPSVRRRRRLPGDSSGDHAGTPRRWATDYVARMRAELTRSRTS